MAHSILDIRRRRLLQVGGGFILAAGLGSSRGLAKEVSVADPGIDPLTLIDPELREGAAQMQGFATQFKLTEGSLQTNRAMVDRYAAPPLADVPVMEKRIAGSPRQPDVRVYIVNAKPGQSRPGVLHTHGGGFVTGTAKSGIRPLQALAKTLDCAIVTVDYRLAPETTFSGSIEDNYAGLKWMHAHAAEIGIDPARIAVMGESAGGGHAALLAIAARDRGEVPLVMQVLIYPMLDDRTGSSRPVPRHIGTLVWTAELNRLGWRAFLGQEPGGPGIPIAAVPARIENLSKLPAAFIGVGALDLFVNEDIAYASRLIDAGVPTDLLVVPGAFHGFDLFKTAAVTQRFEQAILNALRRGFGLPLPS